MNTIKIKHGNTKMIAHRGVSGLECENTNAAFVAAGNRSHFGIETDVHVTSDGKFAIIHDDNTARVSGVKLGIEQSTLEELQKLSLYDKAEGVYRTDLHIGVLAEYIRICKRYEKKAILELKNPIAPKYIKEMIEEIKEIGWLENTVFISFCWDNLVTVRELLPDQQIQFLTGACDDALIENMKARDFGLDILHTSMTEELMKKLHENGIEVNCWTVDDPNDAKRLISWGVDYITSNILE